MQYNKTRNPLDDTIFNIDIREERLIIVDYFATFDDETRLSTLGSSTHMHQYTGCIRYHVAAVRAALHACMYTATMRRYMILYGLPVD